MIKPQELRIGSIVLDSYESQRKVLQLFIDSYQGERLTDGDRACYTYQHSNSIPITEEWLRRAGFKPDQKSPVSAWMLRMNGGNKITWCSDGSFSIDIARWAVPFDGPLDYVHQLQNLYFALTLEELTFKP